MRRKSWLLVLILTLLSLGSYSQNTNDKVAKVDAFQKTRILFVLDCSNSMYSRWQSDTKIKIVQNIISNILDTLNGRDNLEIALRAYGHTKDFPPQNCDDTRLEAPFSKNNIENVRAKLKALVPRGTNPLSSAMEKAALDFPECVSCRNIVILITDGGDDCGGDVCEVSKTYQEKGYYIKPFIIGINKGLREQMECIGVYYDAHNEIEFTKVINKIVKLAIYNTSIQVNLLDSHGIPTETNVPIIFYDSKSKQEKYSFIHTMSSNVSSDTLFIDPLINYDLEIHSIPKIRIENISLNPGGHTIVSAKAAQGSMTIKFKGKETQNNNKNNNIPIVIKKGKEIVNIQTINTTEKYLVGKYDIEVLSLPSLKLRDIEIEQSSTTTIEIPLPGYALINKKIDGSIGTLFEKKDNEWIFVSSLNSSIYETLTLLPGTYMIVLRDKQSNRTTNTLKKEFVIESGLNTKVNIE